jgi:tetratricopeptide (TPR) repeat protein
MKRAALFLALATGTARAAQTPPSPAPSAPDAAQVEQVLARDVRALPKSEAGRWQSWSAKDPVPEALQASFGAAMRAYGAADYNASIAALYAVLDAEPDYPPALYQLGLCYFRLRRYGDGAAAFERFVAAVPNEIGATQALGHCYYSLGEFERAKEHYARVLEQSPEAVEAIRGLALSHMRLGDSARALELLQRVLELRETHAEAHAWMAQLFFETDRTEEALVHARRAQELDPFEPKPWFLASQILAELGRAEEASKARARFDELSQAAQELRQLEGLLLHDPRQMPVWMRIGEVQFGIGNTVRAKEAATRAVQCSPRDWRARLFLLRALTALRDPDAAKAAKELESIAGDQREAWQALADYYHGLGDTQGFLRSAERAKRLER